MEAQAVEVVEITLLATVAAVDMAVVVAAAVAEHPAVTAVMVVPASV